MTKEVERFAIRLEERDGTGEEFYNRAWVLRSLRHAGSKSYDSYKNADNFWYPDYNGNNWYFYANAH